MADQDKRESKTINKITMSKMISQHKDDPHDSLWDPEFVRFASFYLRESDSSAET